MTAAPVGALVRLYYDGLPVAPGDALRTPTGRVYVIASVRVQQKGRHRRRQHLACLVAREPPLDAQVYPLRWYRRKGRRR